MSKGRYAKKKNNGKKWILLLVLVVLLGVLIVLALSGRPGQQAELPEETMEDTVDNTGAGTDAAAATETENAGVQDTQAPEASGATDAPEETQAPAAQTEAPDDTPDATAAPVVATEPPPVQIIERAEAEYEKWLAATMIVCVSMEYPDFQLEGVYAASATELENAMNSEGAYIFFTSGGRNMAIHSKPLTGERSEPGTMEISSQTLGFASFDQISADSVDLATLTEIKLEELGELIEQSVLVTIYR